MKYDDTSDTSLGDQTVESKILYADLLKYGGYRQGAIRKLSASQFTPHWLKNNGTFRPVLIPAPEGGAGAAIVKTPAGGINAETLTTTLGPTVQVQTFDSPTQEQGPEWTLHQWKLYWNKKTARYIPASKTQDVPPPGADTIAAPPIPPLPSADPPLEGINPDYVSRLFSLPALQITGTPLESQISPPLAVKENDLRTTLSLSEAMPQAQLPIMLGMYPSKSFVNSTMAPGAASVWIHVVSGSTTIAVSPPVPKNVALYAAWACGGKTTGLFLHSKCEGSAKAELTAGDTLILPPGYSYSMAVTSSAVILSGGFLRSDSLAIHVDAVRIEEASAKVGLRRQYPEFWQLMWHTAKKYSLLLTEKSRDKVGENFEGKIASRAVEMQKQDTKMAKKADKVAREHAARTAAAAAAAAAAVKGVSRPSSAAGQEGKRRKKRPNDDFIQSDSDWSGGFKGNGGDDDDDDEAEWVPGARQHRGIADSQENSGEEEELDDILDSDAEEYDYQYNEYEDDEYGDEYGGRKRRKTGGKRGVDDIKIPTGERQSKRQRALKSDAPPIALNLAGMPPSSLKVKLKLPTMTPNVAASGIEQQPKPSPIKLTIKRPAPPPDAAAPLPQPPPTTTNIPQVDGTTDDLEDNIELNEGEEQGIPLLYFTLRHLLRKSSQTAITAATTLSYYENNDTPWTVLARLEVSLIALQLIHAPGTRRTEILVTNINSFSRKTLEPTGAPFQNLVDTQFLGSSFVEGKSKGKGYDDYEEDEDVQGYEYESGDNAAMIDEIEEEKYKYRKGGGGGSGRPSSAMGAATSDGRGASNGGGLAAGIDDGATAEKERAKSTPGGGKVPMSKTAAAKMKKLSTKDRLKKKLGL